MDPLASVYPYHRDLVLPHDTKRGGYAHNLTSIQQQTLMSLREWVRDEKIDVSVLNKFAVDPSLTLLRYLRACQFDLGRTTSKIQTNLAWRRNNNVNDISSLNPETILGVPMFEVTRIFPHWHCGYDKFGRPVLYKQYSLFDTTRLKELVGMQRLEKYHVWEQEQCMILCEMQSHKRKQIVETCVAVLDLENMKISQVTSDFIAMIKSMADVDSNQYPETLGAIYIINAPSAFPFVWRMVKGFLDPAVAAKIFIHSSNKKEWQPVLSELIGLDSIPGNYGGHLDPLTQDRHPYEESMLTLGLDNNMNRVDVNSLNNSNSSYGINRNADMQEEESDDEYKSGDAPGTAAAGATNNNKKHLRRYRNLEGRIMIDITTSHTSGGVRRSESDDVESTDGNIYVDAFDSESKIQALNLDLAEDISDAVNEDDNSHHRFSINRRLAKMSTAQLNKLLIGFITVYSITALLAMGFSAYVVSSRVWIGDSARVQLWTGVLVLLASIVIIFSNCIGIMGIYYKNRVLIKFFWFCSVMGMLVFLIVSIACFIYAANRKFGNSILHKALHKSSSGAAKIIIKNQIIVGSCAFVAAVISIGPIAVSFMLNRRMRRVQGTKLCAEHARWALLVSIYISFVTSAIMLVYGGSALEYLMTINYTRAMFPVYGLIYGGITLLLVSIFGLWAAYTKEDGVLSIYYKLLLPFLFILLMTCTIVSFGSLPGTGSDLSQRYTSSNIIIFKVQSQVLVAAVLCLFASIFQFVSIFSSRALLRAIVQERQDAQAGIQRSHSNSVATSPDSDVSDISPPPNLRRSWLEKAMIGWSIVYGLYLIYFDGTFVIFSAFAHKQANTANSGSWVNLAWHILGKLDKRFLSNDGYMVSSYAILSLVVGPLLLLYAWSLFVRAKFRSPVGIIASIFLLYTSILYYAIEIHNNFTDFSKKYSGAVFAMFLITSVSSIVLPAYVLYREMILANVGNRYLDAYNSNPEEQQGLLANDGNAVENGHAQDDQPTGRTNSSGNASAGSHNSGDNSLVKPSVVIPSSFLSTTRRYEFANQLETKMAAFAPSPTAASSSGAVVAGGGNNTPTTPPHALGRRTASFRTPSSGGASPTSAAVKQDPQVPPKSHEKETPMMTWMHDTSPAAARAGGSGGKHTAVNHKTGNSNVVGSSSSSSSSAAVISMSAANLLGSSQHGHEDERKSLSFYRAESTRANFHGDVELGNIGQGQRLKGQPLISQNLTSGSLASSDGEDDIIIRIPRVKGSAAKRFSQSSVSSAELGPNEEKV
jgi:hypothetical protein